MMTLSELQKEIDDDSRTIDKAKVRLLMQKFNRLARPISHDIGLPYK